MTTPSEPSSPCNSHRPAILVADDEPAILGAVSDYLEDRGFRVIAALNGEDALEIAQYDPPDLILLDVVMPGIDGFETCRRLKANETLRDIPVIFMTVLAETEDRIKGFQAGAVDYVIKPFQYEELVVRVRTHLTLGAMHNQLAARNAKLRQEVADRERVEDALRESEELHRLILASMSDAVFLTDDAGAFKFICPNVHVIFGYSVREVEAMSNIAELLGEGVFVPAELEALGEIRNIERRITDKAQRVHTVLVTVKKVSIRGATLLFACRDITERKRAERDLEHVNRMLREERNIFLRGYVVVFKWQNKEGWPVEYVSANVTDVLGYPAEDFFTGRVSYAGIIAEQDREQVASEVEHYSESGVPHFHHEPYRIIRKDGKTIWLDDFTNVLRNDLGEITHYWGYVVDINERKLAEEELQKAHDELELRVVERTAEVVRVNRILNILRACNQALVRAQEESDFLREICRIIVDLGGYRLAWIGFAEPDEAKTVRPVAHAGFEEGYLETVSITWADSERGRGPTGTAIRSGKPSVARHIETDPVFAPWRDEAILRGYASSIALPLHSDDQVIGTLNIYSGEPDRFSPQEAELLVELARDLSYGLSALRTRVTRKQAEETLLVERAQLLSILDTINEIAYVADMETHEVLFMNRFGQELFGRDPVGGKCYKEFQGFEHPCEFCTNPILIEKKGEPFRWDYHNPVLDRDYQLTDRMIRWPDGRDVRFELAFDITERKLAEQALRQSEEKYRLLVDNAPIGIISIDREGRILEVNRKVLEIMGSPSAEATKAINVLTFPPLVQAGVSDAVSLCMEEAKPVTIEAQHTSKRGKESFLRLVLTPKVDARNNVYGCQAVVEDVTEEKNFEKQLLHAQKMEAIGTLAGGMAHDFNNLLTVILGYSELLLASKSKDDPDYAELQVILQTCARATDLVQRILTFSRKVETRRRPLNLNAELKKAEGLLARTIPKMITIELVLEERLKNIHADPGQIEQVLLNLVVNSQHAIGDRTGKIVIETKGVWLDEDYCRSHIETTPGEYVLLSVSDTGHGMEKDILDRIFEPFFTTKKAGEGTGLGLAMVFGIVQGHGGHITCYSEPGVGTTFKIYFPVIELEAQPEVSTTGEMPAFGTGTILVVDDEEYIRDLAVRILSRAGYRVLTAGNGQEALDIYRKKKGEISLVILDLIMPQMGGKECLERLLDIDPKAKVIIASGLLPEEAAREALRRSAKGFVRKPYNFREMLLAVSDVLGPAGGSV